MFNRETGEFPRTRMRRMRRDAFSRRLMREQRSTADNLIYPMFVIEGRGRRETIASMPDMERVRIDHAGPRGGGTRASSACRRWLCFR